MVNERDWGPGNPVWEDIQEEKAMAEPIRTSWLANGWLMKRMREPGKYHVNVMRTAAHHDVHNREYAETWSVQIGEDIDEICTVASQELHQNAIELMEELLEEVQQALQALRDKNPHTVYERLGE